MEKEQLLYEMTDAYASDFLYELNETDKNIKDNVNHFLNEAINRTVIDTCYNIFNRLIEDIKSKPKQYIKGFDGVTYKTGSFRYKMDISPYEIVNIKVPDRPILLNYIVYNFKDRDTKEYFDKNDREHLYASTCMCNGSYLNSINLSLFTISGHADIPHWVDSLQHELSHEFEQTNMGTHYNINPIYEIVTKYINSDNEGERSIATILYCYDKSELKGFSNGLYGYMVARKIIFPNYKNLRHSDYFIMMVKLKQSLEYLRNNKDDRYISEIIGKYRLKYSNIIQRGEIAVKVWQKEAARVIKQYNSEIQKIHDIFISDFKPSYI